MRSTLLLLIVVSILGNSIPTPTTADSIVEVIGYNIDATLGIPYATSPNDVNPPGLAIVINKRPIFVLNPAVILNNSGFLHLVSPWYGKGDNRTFYQTFEIEYNKTCWGYSFTGWRYFAYTHRNISFSGWYRLCWDIEHYADKAIIDIRAIGSTETQYNISREFLLSYLATPYLDDIFVAGYCKVNSSEVYSLVYAPPTPQGRLIIKGSCKSFAYLNTYLGTAVVFVKIPSTYYILPHIFVISPTLGGTAINTTAKLYILTNTSIDTLIDLVQDIGKNVSSDLEITIITQPITTNIAEQPAISLTDLFKILVFIVAVIAIGLAVEAIPRKRR